MNALVTNLETMFKPTGDAGQSLTVEGTAVALDALPEKCTHVYITVHSSAVNARFDGVDPTSATGHQYAAGYTRVWTKEMASAAKFIRVSSSAVVFVTPVTHN